MKEIDWPLLLQRFFNFQPELEEMPVIAVNLLLYLYLSLKGKK